MGKNYEELAETKTLLYDDRLKRKQWSIKQAKIKAIELIKEIESRGIKK